MSILYQKIKKRAKHSTDNIIHAWSSIWNDWIHCIIEAYKKDLQTLLADEGIIDNYTIQETQNMFLELCSDVQNQQKTNKLINEAIEKLRIIFRAIAKQHNWQLLNPDDTNHTDDTKKQKTTSQVIKTTIKNPPPIQSIKPENNTPASKHTANLIIKKTWAPVISDNNKNTAAEDHEAIKKNMPKNIFQTKKSNKREKTNEEKLFDIKMRHKSPTLYKPTPEKILEINQSNKTTIVPIPLTEKEQKIIQDLLHQEQLIDIKIRSEIQKLHEIKIIQNNWRQIVENYSIIIDLLDQKNTTIQKYRIYIQESKKLLRELRNKLEKNKHSAHLFKAEEQKNKSHHNITRIKEYIENMVQFT